LNKFRKIKIHTFGFDPVVYPENKAGRIPNPDLQSANKFLKELAEKTGGTFTIMKVDTTQTPDNPRGKRGKEKKGKNTVEAEIGVPVLF